jgi:hypothetical protein
VARSREGQQSDVDLMIVGGGALRGCSRPNRRCTENDQPYVYTANEFRGKLRGNFLETVLGESKLFLIGDEDFLRKLGQ